MAGNGFGGFVERIKSLDFKTYDVRLATILCIFLSIVLWWIPIIGPAVAGYVTGRKSGSMIKGFFIPLIAGTVIVFFAWAFAGYILPRGGFPDIPADQAAANIGGVSGLFAFYLSAFYTDGTSYLALSQLGVLAVFGLVGGVLSRQIRIETAQLLSSGAVDNAIRGMSRSAELYESKKSMGFRSYEDCMARQGMMVNENPDTNSSEHTNVRQSGKAKTTVQTVTMSSAPVTMTSDDSTTDDPFADILGRADGRKKDQF